jgi:hypothetical protein
MCRKEIYFIEIYTNAKLNVKLCFFILIYFESALG